MRGPSVGGFETARSRPFTRIADATRGAAALGLGVPAEPVVPVPRSPVPERVVVAAGLLVAGVFARAEFGASTDAP